MKKLITVGLLCLLLVSAVSALSMTDSLEAYGIDKEYKLESIKDVSKETLAVWYWKQFERYRHFIEKYNFMKKDYDRVVAENAELKDRSCGGGGETIRYITQYVEVPVACQEGCPMVSCPFGYKMQNQVYNVCGCLEEWDCVQNIQPNPRPDVREIEGGSDPTPEPEPVPPAPIPPNKRIEKAPDARLI